MKVEILWGTIVGLVVGMLLVILILKVTKNDGSIKCKYDERQEMARGRGFKYAFFFLLFYNMLFSFMLPMLEVEKIIMDSSTISLLGIVISMLVYVVYCIWHECYFSLNENPKKVLVAFAFIAIFNFIIGMVQVSHYGILEDGQITYHSTNLLSAIIFVVIFLVLLAKFISNKRRGE